MRLTGLAFIGSLLACGSLSDGGDRPPLALIEGQLEATSTAPPPSNIRIAMLWLSHDFGAERTTQDIAASPVFPSRFKLEISGRPPAPAMANLFGLYAAAEKSAADSGLRISESPRPPVDLVIGWGLVVAYEDRNGNGALDLVDNDDTGYVDHVLGANRDLSIVYVEGTISDDLKAPNGSLPSPGYNMLRLTHCPRPRRQLVPNEPPPPPPPCDTSRDGWLPISTLYELPLSGDPHFESVTCRKSSSYLAGDPDEEPPPLPPPVDPNYDYPPYVPGPYPTPAKTDPMLACAADGRAYRYQQCEYASQGLCEPPLSRCSIRTTGIPRSATPPPDWPCTIP